MAESPKTTAAHTCFRIISYLSAALRSAAAVGEADSTFQLYPYPSCTPLRSCFFVANASVRLTIYSGVVYNASVFVRFTTACGVHIIPPQMDLDDLEKQWEEGDDEWELKTEEQTKFERLERRRKQAQAKAGSLDPR